MWPTISKDLLPHDMIYVQVMYNSTSYAQKISISNAMNYNFTHLNFFFVKKKNNCCVFLVNFFYSLTIHMHLLHYTIKVLHSQLDNCELH